MNIRSTLPALLLLASAACGDDGGSTPIDAPMIDTLTIDTPPAVVPGDLCSNADPITLTGGQATITASTVPPITHNYEPGVCAKVNSLGNDRVHSLTIPAGQRLTATVDPTAATFDPGIFLIAGPAASCDAMPIVCLAQNDTGGDGENDAITFDNTTANPVDVFIMIDSFQADGAEYTLTVAVAAIQ